MKINKLLKFGISIIILIFSLASSVQSQGIQEILKKVTLHNQKYPEEIVYLQTDRSNYSPGETIWFKAYIMQDIGNQANQLSKNLFVALIDQDTLKIINKVFLIEKNMASGNIAIPVLVTSGNYKLIAYTSWMKNTPIDRVFSKELVIEKEIRNNFAIDIKLKDTISLPGSSLTALLDFNNSISEPVSTPFTYRLTGNMGTITEGEGSTDKAGKAVVNITLPESDPMDNLRLLVDASYKNANVSAGIVIPTPDNYLDVKFYPEGGLLIYGAGSRVAFRAFNIADRPVDFKGEIVTATGKKVKEIESTYKGIGSFNFTPEKGEVYYLKITHPSTISKTFMLPDPKLTGAILSVTDKTADVLTLNVVQIDKPAQVYHFIARVKGKVYWSQSVEIAEHAQLNIPLRDFPSGVAEISSFDASGTLAAKRLVYINENKKLNVEINADKQLYSKKERIALTISVKDEKGNPVEADLSLSVVNKEFNQLPDNNNLYTFLNLRSNLLGYIPTPMIYFEDNEISEDIIDNLLIANAFSRSTWQNVLSTKETDAAYNKVDDDEDKVTYSDFDKNDAAYITRDLRNNQLFPGRSYTVQEKNDMQKIMNLNRQITYKKVGYESGMNIMDVIYSIKTYELINGEIVFSGVGINSINFPGGAGIVIDGSYTGTNPSVLTSLVITEIEKINVYTNAVDIQRFTGLNSMGIVEVLTKRGDSANKIVDTGYTDMRSKVDPKTNNRKTVYWNPEFRTDKTGQAKIVYLNSDIPSDVVITVEGRTISGLAGSSSQSYEVK